jgi:predicted histone-like DNA-binding protein
MAIKYKLVQRKDLSKGAAPDGKLYYASTNVTGMMDFETVCEVIADRSTASDGDVALVLKGLIRCLREALVRGEVVQLSGLGNIRLSVGSSGVADPADFQASLLRKPKIIFSPGVKLKEILNKVSTERLEENVSESEESEENDKPEEL